MGIHFVTDTSRNAPMRKLSSYQGRCLIGQVVYHIAWHKNVRGLMAVASFSFIVVILISLAIPKLSNAQSNMALSNPLIYLDIFPGPAGGDGKACVRFDSNSVSGFNLLLQFEPNLYITAKAEDFSRNVDNFPSTLLGDHILNQNRDSAAGKVRLVGLAPVADRGISEAGCLRLHIVLDAPIGETQAVTLTGEINRVGIGIVTIEPVIGFVKVIEMNQQYIYLPLILIAR